MVTIQLRTVGELVAEQPSRSLVFEKLGIDYCCGGNVTLEAACLQSGHAVETVLPMLSATVSAEEPIDWRTQPLDQLIDHILFTHHSYLQENLPRLSALVAKVANRHSESHPELQQLHKQFEVFKISMEGHLASEEKIIFPVILSQLLANGEATATQTAKETLPTIFREHDIVGEDLRTMRKITENYMPPPDACNSYRAMLDGLEALERDIHIHVHLENNILFPRASVLMA
ncbi:MAG: iron-sulfur cluster repair di-iron protein [bacterium]|nr:iron-sulfur cluster repair di-iron protein [bacterium]